MFNNSLFIVQLRQGWLSKPTKFKFYTINIPSVVVTKYFHNKDEMLISPSNSVQHNAIVGGDIFVYFIHGNVIN